MHDMLPDFKKSYVIHSSVIDSLYKLYSMTWVIFSSACFLCFSTFSQRNKVSCCFRSCLPQLNTFSHILVGSFSYVIVQFGNQLQDLMDNLPGVHIGNLLRDPVLVGFPTHTGVHLTFQKENANDITGNGTDSIWCDCVYVVSIVFCRIHQR